jgi:hypothetical protein
MMTRETCVKVLDDFSARTIAPGTPKAMTGDAGRKIAASAAARQQPAAARGRIWPIAWTRKAARDQRPGYTLDAGRIVLDG